MVPHLILAYAAKDKVAFILHPEQDEIVARIDVGAEGAVGMAWSGKGDTVMSWSASHVSDDDALRVGGRTLTRSASPLRAA